MQAKKASFNCTFYNIPFFQSFIRFPYCSPFSIVLNGSKKYSLNSNVFIFYQPPFIYIVLLLFYHHPTLYYAFLGMIFQIILQHVYITDKNQLLIQQILFLLFIIFQVYHYTSFLYLLFIPDWLSLRWFRYTILT